MKSNRHKQKAGQLVKIKPCGLREDSVRTLREKKELKCSYCGKQILRINNMRRHMNVCSDRNKMETQISLMAEKLQQYQKELDNKDKELEHRDTELDYYKKMLDDAGYMAKTSVRTLTYLIKNHKRTPALTKLKQPQLLRIQHMGDDFVADLIYRHRDNQIVDYLGDFIVKSYKKENRDHQAIWNTDTSRLTYVIRELLDEESKWIVDKKGRKTEQFIINPLLSYIRDAAEKYSALICSNMNTLTRHHRLKVAEKAGLIMKMVGDIDNGSLSKGILRYISPHFYFVGE